MSDTHQDARWRGASSRRPLAVQSYPIRTQHVAHCGIQPNRCRLNEADLATIGFNLARYGLAIVDNLDLDRGEAFLSFEDNRVEHQMAVQDLDFTGLCIGLTRLYECPPSRRGGEEGVDVKPKRLSREWNKKEMTYGCFVGLRIINGLFP